MTTAVGRELRYPGPALRWLGRRLARRRPQDVDGASPAYFEWQAGTAAGAWAYYSRFLDAEPDLVLDVASGASGRTTVHARCTPARFVCLDRGERLLSSTRREMRERGLDRLRPVAGDAYRLPFPDAAFAVVLCENAFEHLERPDAAVVEMARVLAPGGRLLLLFPPWRGAYAGHLGWLTWMPWLHLLPEGVFAALVGGLLAARSGQDPAAWRDDLTGLLQGLSRDLNAWPLRRVLEAVSRGGGLSLLGAYVLGEGRLGRVLRYLPWAGELFANAVYLVLEKKPGGRAVPRTYNGLLGRTLQWTLRRSR